MTLRYRTRRRGVGLVQVVAGFFVSGLVLTLCVPLYLAAQRHAEAGVARSRMAEQARRLTARLREDVRQSVSARVLRGGSALELVLGRAGSSGDVVLYQPGQGSLVRTLRPGGPGRGAERELYPAPLTLARFERNARAVRAQLFFEQRVNGRPLAFTADCLAAPRAGAARSSGLDVQPEGTASAVLIPQSRQEAER